MNDYEHIARSARSVAALFEWSDVPFLELAYRVMLRRPMDAEGQDYYLRRLRYGHSRTAILDQLRKAPEADPLWHQIKDLQAVLDRYRQSRRFFAGAWLRWTDPDIGTTPAIIRSRILENALGRMRQDTAEGHSHVRAEQVAIQEKTNIALRQLSILRSENFSAKQDSVSMPVHDTQHQESAGIFDWTSMDLSATSARVAEAMKFMIAQSSWK